MAIGAGQRGLDILAFEPFDGGSHRAVRESIERRSRHRWRWITRPPRAWKWRMRLAAAECLELARRAGALERPADAILVTSLMSAADLRALLPASWRGVPLVLYMHENQAAYPAGHETAHAAERDAHFALTNLTGVLSADLVIWNSRWNLDSFVDGIDRLVRLAPDPALPDLPARIAERSRVIWPPVEPPPFDGTDRPGVLHKPARVAWPHRWEHDKGPEELLELAERHGDRLDLRWIVLGQRFRRVPPALEAFCARCADRIEHVGWEPDRRGYWERLRSADWVLSTARHEFFGVAVVEALLAGCLPWLPPRLSYPELLPESARDLSPLAPPADPASARREIIEHLRPALAANAVARIDDAIEGSLES